MNIFFLYFILPLAFIVEYFVGFAKYKLHPLNIMGMIALYIKRLFYSISKGVISGFFFNIVTIILILTIFLFISLLIFFVSHILFYIFSIYIFSSFLSTGGLRYEALKIYSMIKAENIDGARKNLSSLAGRDAKNLNSSEISRAVVESVSENTGDGIGSVIFYFALGVVISFVVIRYYHEIKHIQLFAAIFSGLLSSIFYKTANLLDSMVGYRNEQYEKFGKFSARLDDILNFIPFRITAFLMMLAIFILSITLNNSKKHSKEKNNINNIYSIKDALLSFIKYRKNHPSPNGGQLESVTAGALKVKLGGVNYYNGIESRRPVIGFEDYSAANTESIVKSVKIMQISSIIIVIFYTVIMIIYCYYYSSSS